MRTAQVVPIEMSEGQDIGRERPGGTALVKTVFVKTYGCQMNVYDSARMTEVLAPLGYRPVSVPDGADFIIVNTCHIREKASEKVFSELGRLRRHKEARAAGGGRMFIAVTGCVAQAEGAEILRRAPYVDMVLGPQTYHRLPELVARMERAETGGAGRVATDFPVEAKFDHLPARDGGQTISAFLTVQEGCDKFCSFCVVPYTRGAEFSRPVAQVLAEAAQLVRGGAREIVLLGQNVNAYRGQGPDGAPWGLDRLISALAPIAGLTRLRYTTSHPADMDDRLIAAHRDVPMLMPYLHLPVQSGADRILRAMNRRHTGDDYRRLVRRLRAARPDIALSSDFIVGFPGESEADFEQTLALVGEIGFTQAYSFKYSPRPGTPASLMDGQVPESVKADRLARLQILLDSQQAAFNRQSVGQTMPVLVERPGRRPGQMVGRSPYLQAVRTAAPVGAIGSTIELRITASDARGLAGVPVAHASERVTA